MDMMLIDNEGIGNNVKTFVNLGRNFFVILRKFLGKFFG